MNTKNIFALFVFLLIGLNSYSQVVINEVMHFPTTAQGIIDAGTEYIELYNTSCSPVDISCYILSARSTPNSNPTSALATGGSILIPQGTVIGPKGHFVIGTSISSTDPNAIDFKTDLNTSYYCTTGNFILSNSDGWLALYNGAGIPLDAIYWTTLANQSGKISSDDDYDDAPCTPSSNTGCNTSGITLLSAKGISISYPTLITYVGQTNGTPVSAPSAPTGKTFSRIPDGGSWQRDVTASIIGSNCNGGTCSQTFSISAAITSPNCNASDGSIIITPNPAGVYTYTWTSPAVSTTNTATGLPAGTYTISVGQGGCSTNTIITLASAGAPTITSVQITAPSCGNNDGSATITATPAADSYTWSSGVTSPTNTANNLATGNYTVTLSLAGCITNTIITIPSQTCCPASLTYSLSVTNNTICNATSTPCNYSGPSILINEVALNVTNNDGSIYGPGPGGAGSGEGEWLELFNPDWCNSIDISGYILGSYNSSPSTVPRSNGMSFALPQGTIVPPLGFVVVRGRNAPTPPAGVIDIVITNTGGRLCIDGGVNTSRIWFQNDGGWFAFYNASGVMQDAIKWGNPPNSDLNGNPCLPTTNSVTAANTPLASANQGGSIVTTLTTVTPTKGSTFVRIPDGGAWSATQVTQNTYGTCNVPGGCVSGGGGSSDCSGTAEVIMTSGTAPYTYTWNDPLNQATKTATALCGGNYTVTVKDANQCEAIATLSVGTALQPVINSLQSTDASCNLSNGTTSFSFSPSSSNITWNPAISANTNSVNNLSAGSYTITVTNGSCSTNSIVVINNIINTYTISPDTTIIKGDSVQISSTNATSYTWSPTTNLSCLDCSNPIAKPIQTTTYCVVSFDGVCTYTNCVTINVEIPCIVPDKFSFPNAFSPNGDGKNDEFCIEGLGNCIKYFKISIYNRWGEMVYSSNDPNFCWDGKYNGIELDPSVFVYYINTEYLDKKIYTLKGNITLLR